jgi:hypothetical protein
MRIGRQRSELEQDRNELASRQARLADHIERAARACDHRTTQQLIIEVADVEHKLEETCFVLELLDEVARAVD